MREIGDGVKGALVGWSWASRPESWFSIEPGRGMRANLLLKMSCLRLSVLRSMWGKRCRLMVCLWSSRPDCGLERKPKWRPECFTSQPVRGRIGWTACRCIDENVLERRSCICSCLSQSGVEALGLVHFTTGNLVWAALARTGSYTWRYLSFQLLARFAH